MKKMLIKRLEGNKCWINLFRLSQRDYEEYVTWVSNLDTPDNYYWGHYFPTLEMAEKDFADRVERGY